jgi:hypothetical protein
MPILWTFENQVKLESFRAVLNDNEIPHEVVSKSGKVDETYGLIVTVGDYEYKRAKKILLKYRKRLGNRHNK